MQPEMVMTKNNVLAEQEARDKQYRTKPFLAGAWGGIHGYNVPVHELSRLYEAFATLTPGFVIELSVRGPVHTALTGGPLLIEHLTSAEPLLHGFVEVSLCMDKQTDDCTREYQSVYPDNETWQEIELTTK